MLVFTSGRHYLVIAFEYKAEYRLVAFGASPSTADRLKISVF